jgi:hypothetical protein
MHIEIEFQGTVEAIAGQYIEVLDQVGKWLKSNEIASELGWFEGRMIIKLQDLDSYCLWLATVHLDYKIVNQA